MSETVTSSTPPNDQGSFQEEKEDAMTMFQIIAMQFKSHRMAMGSLMVILFLVLTSLSAPLISKVLGIDPDAQSVFNRYAPVFAHIELSRSQQDQALEGFASDFPERTARLVQQLKEQGLITRDSADPIDTFLDYTDTRGEAFLGQMQSIGSPESEQLVAVVSDFKRFHILGTDELGRDVLMRLIYGARVSIGVGILVALAGALIGILIGSVAGYYGGWLDSVLMRVTDSLLALPILPLMIVFAAVDLGKVPLLGSLITGQNESIMKLVVILVLFSWMQAARLIRGSILSVREREFVLAAKTLGARDNLIIRTHVVPNVVAPLLVAVTLRVGSSILFEAALSFLGLGIQPPTPSWGNMLFNAQEIIHEAPQLAVMPGLLIFITVICFNFVGDGLQDAIDPKSIRR